MGPGGAGPGAGGPGAGPGAGGRVRPAGDSALLVDVGDQGAAHLLRASVLDGGVAGVVEVVVGARTVLVRLDPSLVSPAGIAELAGRLARWASDAEAGSPERGGVDGPVLEVPVSYDGPDLADVADLVGLSVEEVVGRHLAATYTVGFVGFSPGFAYLSGLDPALVLPRLHAPRQRVPAGSVAIAGPHTAVYPQATPGGWHLLGTTPLRAFDPRARPPTPFSPGGRVRFVAGSGRARPASGEDERTSAGHLAAPVRGHKVVVEENRAELSAHSTGLSARFAATMLVERAGTLTTVQDMGRPGLAHLGVPRAGAVDLPSLARANALVGNPDGAAGLEATLLGPDLRAEGATVVALTGGLVNASLDGEPVAMRRAITMPAGSVLSVGTVRAGLRTYVGIAGGIDVEPVLGSRSTDTLAGLGPAPLRAGDRLALGIPRAGTGPPGTPYGAWHPVTADEPVVVRVMMGPREDWFTDGALATLLGSAWQVTPESNRTGVRLSGPALTRSEPARELLPEGMVAGAIQVPPGGQPIVLLANHPATGGYPVIAVVTTADLARVAQARPGEALSFRRVPAPTVGA